MGFLMAKHAIVIEFCEYCREDSRAYISVNNTLVCNKCRQIIYREPRNCLKCDLEFRPISKHNRICSTCTNKNHGVETYGNDH